MKETAIKIGEYIDILKSKLGLNVTLHDIKSCMGSVISVLAPYNIHSSPYCLCMKKSRDVWDRCISGQEKIMNKLCDGAFLGMCYLGVSEYVFPVEYEKEILGFICVSGYRTDDEKAFGKMKRAAARLGLDFEEMKKAYISGLSPDIPPRKEIEAFISPLVCMVRELIKKSRRAGEHGLQNDSGSIIYGHILAYINLHFSENISISDLCELCHCSSSHISHVFAAHHGGQTISEHIKSLRMREAKALLLETELRIGEIAAAVGYNDSNYFCNVFKKEFGISPREYRKSIK